MSTPSPPSISPSRRAAREALHARFAQVERIGSPSQIALLSGFKRTWTEAEFAELWVEAVRRSGPTTVNNLYVHVPFCKSICSFCNYERLRPTSPGALKDWRDRVLASIEVMGKAARGIRFHSLYFGGGTPSVPTAAMLGEVFTALDTHFAWHPKARRAIELDPAVMNPAKVAAMVEHGFEQFSFGVQSTRTDVNLAHNRGAQSPELIDRCLNLLPPPHEAKVTVDVLMGLAGTTPADTLADLEMLLSHPRRPWVDLFHLTPTHSYVDSHYGGVRARADDAVAAYDQAFDDAVDALCEQHFYDTRRGGSHHCRTLVAARPTLPEGVRRLGVWSSEVRERWQRWWTAKRAPRRMGRTAYCQVPTEVRAPLNLLGIGPSARSQVFGLAMAQTRPHAGESGPTVYAGHPMQPIDELRNFVCFDVRDRGEVVDAHLEALFGMTLAEAMPEAVAVWQESGFARPTDTGWAFERGRPAEVARSLLWAVSDDHLEGIIARKNRRGR